MFPRAFIVMPVFTVQDCSSIGTSALEADGMIATDERDHCPSTDSPEDISHSGHSLPILVQKLQTLFKRMEDVTPLA